VRTLTDALQQVEIVNHSNEQRGVWTVTGQNTVSERVSEFISTADNEIVYMTVEGLLTDELAEQLSRTSDRGVTIRLADLSQSTEKRSATSSLTHSCSNRCGIGPIRQPVAF